LRWVLAAALLLAGGGVLAMRAGHPPEAEAPRRLAVGRPVLVAAVAPATRPANAYTGVVAARTDSGLGFRVGGKVVERCGGDAGAGRRSAREAPAGARLL
jgi:hypothetical protein